MTTWARLTWQAPDPAAFAARLGVTLAIEPRGGADAGGSVVFALDGAMLEVRPWLRESAADDPAAGGRLLLEPVPGGEEPVDDDAATLALAGVGWATVELDRAEDELGPWLGPPVVAASPADEHLGAAARVRAAGGLPGETFVLLEPNTEGRLAASLARDGEGPCALYLRPAAGLASWADAAVARGVTLSAARPGPLGPARLVVGGPVAGPHLLLVDAERPSNRIAAAGTIAP